MLLAIAVAALTSPCVSATPDCTEWITTSGDSARVRVYRTVPLTTRNEKITRAFVFVHGIRRDADSHFRTALAAAFLAGALEDTVLVAPRFASNGTAPGNPSQSCGDTLSPDEANWVCQPDRPESWRTGGARTGGKTSSFDVMDEILRKLARRDAFPNLKAIVVAGHSAGGQFVTRYEMLNPVHESLGVPVSYLVSNPSAYAYPDAVRPTASLFAEMPSAVSPGYVPPPQASPPPLFATFADAGNCVGYDAWPYGLRARPAYQASLTLEQIEKNLVSRPVTYLLGEIDILPLGIFDTSCPAMAQGPTRLARGLAFGRYVREVRGGKHATVVVPFCGHSQRCVFTSDQALPLMFPK
jgi:pimeloyl-ACP methyl ester carboxylesterase